MLKTNVCQAGGPGKCFSKQSMVHGRAPQPAYCATYGDHVSLPIPSKQSMAHDVPISLLTARLMGLAHSLQAIHGHDVPLSLLTARLIGITCPCMEVPISLLTA